jgi:hypothetical protein
MTSEQSEHEAADAKVWKPAEPLTSPQSLVTSRFFGEMAERTGLEPATPGVTGRYSNQLNYRSAL